MKKLYLVLKNKCILHTGVRKLNKKSHLASYGHILSGQKLPKITKTMINLTSFWNTESCSQTVLPDRSILIGQKMLKVPIFKWDVLGDFQTMWVGKWIWCIAYIHVNTK